MSLRIDSARYGIAQGYPFLALTIGSREAILDSQPHPILADAGIHFLGGDFARDVPPIEFRPPDGEPITLRGFTDDPLVARMFREFLAADPFVEGPIEIPVAE